MNAFSSVAESGMFLIEFVKTLNHSTSALGEAYGHSHNYGSIAKAEIGEVAQYVGTPAVARDMLSIVEALGQDKLQYWGISYVSMSEYRVLKSYRFV